MFVSVRGADRWHSQMEGLEGNLKGIISKGVGRILGCRQGRWSIWTGKGGVPVALMPEGAKRGNNYQNGEWVAPVIVRGTLVEENSNPGWFSEEGGLLPLISRCLPLAGPSRKPVGKGTWVTWSVGISLLGSVRWKSWESGCVGEEANGNLSIFFSSLIQAV